MSDDDKPLPDDVLTSLWNLPRLPARPIEGVGFQRFKFPDWTGKSIKLRRLWAAIPSAHKHEGTRCASAEAFNAISNYLTTLI